MVEALRPRVGAFGEYGGRFVPELLVPALEELERARREVLPSREFRKELSLLLEEWAGRPTPLSTVPSFSERCELEVVFKREDLLHGGAHKTNNVAGQALMAKLMGKKRVIAETGAAQHGTATAMAAARLGLEAVIYMGEKDMERQASNVKRMELCGATVIPVTAGARTLKDAINEALRDWTKNGSCATSRRSSAAKRARNGESVSAASPMPSSPAWAEAATPSASSTPSFPKSA